jgi:ketosteroid isomerase-like protein
MVFRTVPTRPGIAPTERRYCAPMDPTSLEFWEWFYAAANEGPSMSPEERLRAVEERWHPDLVLIQSPEMPGTAGEFHGYEGLAAVNRELYESWETIDWRPREVHELGEGRYLVLLETSGRARLSGLELEGGEIAHLVTLRDGKAERLAYLGWEAARGAAGLG